MTPLEAAEACLRVSVDDRGRVAVLGASAAWKAAGADPRYAHSPDPEQRALAEATIAAIEAVRTELLTLAGAQ